MFMFIIALPLHAWAVPVAFIKEYTYDAGEARKDLRGRYRIYEIADSCSTGQRPAFLSEALRVWEPSTESFVEDRSSGAALSASA